MPSIEVIGCQTGCQRYPGVSGRVVEAGGTWATTECFDKCEQCERGLLARVDGALMRFAGVDELLHAVLTLGAE